MGLAGVVTGGVVMAAARAGQRLGQGRRHRGTAAQGRRGGRHRERKRERERAFTYLLPNPYDYIFPSIYGPYGMTSKETRRSLSNTDSSFYLINSQLSILTNSF
jgi:hypothetical protein